MNGEFRSRYRYVVEATNRMMAVAAYVERQPMGALAQAAAQACDALTMLLDEKRFLEDLKKWEQLASNTQDERVELQRELEHLATAFLKAEKQALLDTSHDPDAVEQILWLAAAYKQAAAVPLRSQEIMGHINNLRKASCDAATELYRVQDAQRRRGIFYRIASGMGGVSLIVADMTAALPSGGIAAASMTIGGAIVGRAVA